MDMPGIPKQGLHCYGEASLETNMEMQELLEKLYEYENQPDMREKVKEYIAELDDEIDRCNEVMQWEEDKIKFEIIKSRANTLIDVKNDLKGRLEELV